MRKKIIAGNWKMNKTPGEAAELVDILKQKMDTEQNDVVFCVPFVAITTVAALLQGTRIKLGAQNVYFEENGAFTGEISPAMLANANVSYVIIGHSERRAYFGETDETVNRKMKKCLEHDLIPIVCVGETLMQREQGITIDWVRMQAKIAFMGIPKEEAQKIVIAYEPIWAIGTGKTATSEQAQEVCAAIRQVIAQMYDAGTADTIRIQYGGSVTKDNAAELFAMSDIDGGLVGGASLNEQFIDIVNRKQ